MYICLECLSVFEEPEYYRETHGLDSPPYEELSACPYCGGEYACAKQCDICGEWIAGEYAELDNGMTICDDCYIVKHIEDGDN